MADPQSLFASCAGLGKVCRALHKTVRTAQEQHVTIQLLRIEVKRVIETVEKLKGFEDESLCKTMQATETRHWRDATQVIDDCQTTVIRLNRLIANPNESRNVLGRA